MPYGVATEIAESLKQNGVEDMFFVTGGDQPFWIALKDAGIRLHLARSEASAVYMADGFARAARRPAAVYGQWGPGAANVAAALADAWWARSPVIAICSGLPTRTQYRNDYQGLDQVSMFAPVTKSTVLVPTAARAGELVRAAIRLATSGCPRPVQVTVPRDVLEADGDVSKPLPALAPASPPAPDPAALKQAVDMLARAERPVILAGNGVLVAGAEPELAELAGRTGIPVVTSMGGKGSLPDHIGCPAGVVGKYARKASNSVIAEADLVLVLGCDLDGMVTDTYRLPAAGARLIQVDIDPDMLGATRSVELPIHADVKQFLLGLNHLLREQPPSADQRAWTAAVISRMADAQDAFTRAAGRPEPHGYMYQETVLAELASHMGTDDTLVVDTGYMGAWGGALFPVRKAGRHFLRAAGSLGWAFPAALGAQLAAPGGRTVCLIGDGGFGYHVGDLETAVRLKIPAVTLVLNNGGLAFEYHMQKYHYGNRIVPEVNDFADVDYGAVARTFGAYGARVRTQAELREALQEALGGRRPALIDVMVSRERFPPVTSYDRVLERDL